MAKHLFDSSERHGMSRNNPIYTRWITMKSRCNNPHNPAYDRYGGRGITVCDEWNLSFMSFYNWALLNGYTDGLTLDRIDNEKGYSPDNCRWANPKQQSRNKRTNHLITYNGKTQCIAEWADEIGIRKDTLRYRLIHFDSLDDVFKPTKYKPWGARNGGDLNAVSV